MDEEPPPTKNITTLHKYDTEYSADSVEWCPHEPHQDVFVCANYQLVESSRPDDKCKRVGRILLFSTNKYRLELLQTVETPAVLDQKWCHNLVNNRSLLGIVNAKGCLVIYELCDQRELNEICQYEISHDETENLMLSLDWNTGKSSTNRPEIVCSDSKGFIHLFRFDEAIILIGSYKAHDYEAWISCFNYWDTNVYFSGGDDCKFLKFDQRVGSEAVGINRKSHEAGVTSMHSNARREHVLATGSYDTKVRLWDQRALKHPSETISTPGTLWRLKWDPFEYNYLLSACMLGGVHIINTSTLEIVDSYYEHKNIAYGADWSHSQPDPLHLIASCSFYDHLLCISQIKHL